MPRPSAGAPTIDATAVPWCSSGPGAVRCWFRSRTLVAENSGWVTSTPVSTIATGLPGGGACARSAPTAESHHSPACSGSTARPSGRASRSGAAATTPGRRFATRSGTSHIRSERATGRAPAGTVAPGASATIVAALAHGASAAAAASPTIPARSTASKYRSAREGVRRSGGEPRRPRGDDPRGDPPARRRGGRGLGAPRDRAVGLRRPATVLERGAAARDDALAACAPRAAARGRARARPYPRRPALGPARDRPRPAPLRGRRRRRAGAAGAAPAPARARLRARAAARPRPGARDPGPRPRGGPARGATLDLMSHLDELDEFEAELELR